MPTAWTLTASEICTDALRHLNVIGEDEAASGGQMQDALRGLDTVLKELSPFGYHWPKLSGEVSLTWAGAQTMTLPTDYYGYPVAWKLLNGQKYPLSPITHAEWVRMLNRTGAGAVTHFYIGPDNVLSVWPVPDADPVVTLQYQKIIDDAALTSAPDLLQIWRGSLSYGVADEISMKFSAPQAIRAEVHQRWEAKKAILLANSIPHEPISFSVSE